MNRSARCVTAVFVGTLATTSLTGCFPLVVGGAALGSAVVFTDRRTSGSQLEDQSIELKAYNRLREAPGDRARLSVTSFNQLVLITGETTSEADKALAEQTVSKIENVRSTVNEATVASALTSPSLGSDSILTGKVKAAIVDTKDLQVNAFKVVTDRGTVYLMGRVTEREAARGAEVTRQVSGVKKVVRVFEVVTEAELAELQPKPTPK
jgi:osmotically-inducible protein OsmY